MYLISKQTIIIHILKEPRYLVSTWVSYYISWKTHLVVTLIQYDSVTARHLQLKQTTFINLIQFNSIKIIIEFLILSLYFLSDSLVK